MKIITRKGIIRLLVLLGVLVLYGIVSFCVTLPTKEEWLRFQAFSLSHMTINKEMIAKSYPWQNDGKTYIMAGSPGVIPIGTESAVYVVTHSAHNSPSRTMMLLGLPAYLLTGRRPVQDATIAVDQQGRLYTCEGHICGALHLTSKKEVKTLQDFLETYSYGNEKNTWKPYFQK